MNKELFLHIVKNLEASIGTYVSWRISKEYIQNGFVKNNVD